LLKKCKNISAVNLTDQDQCCFVVLGIPC